MLLTLALSTILFTHIGSNQHANSVNINEESIKIPKESEKRGMVFEIFSIITALNLSEEDVVGILGIKSADYIKIKKFQLEDFTPLVLYKYLATMRAFNVVHSTIQPQ